MGLLRNSRILAAGVAKKALTAANIEPAFVKALIKSPAPVHGGPRARRFP